MNDIFSLKNKTAIVTGGYGHLGYAMAAALAAFGANVIVAGRSKEKFDEKFSSHTEQHVRFMTCDILDSGSLASLFKEVKEAYGNIDIVVNNATTASGNSPDKMTDEDWSYSMDAVLGSIHKSIREVIPFMREQGFGKIINISSMYGMVSPDFRLYEGDDCEKYFNPPHYGAAKAGIIQLTKYYATYLGKHHIHVNTITPGPFPSEPIQKENPAFIERLRQKNPLGKIGVPSDLAGVTVLLASPASDFITGQNFVVDGGWTII